MAQAGQPLDPWQRDVLEDALGETPEGRWAASEVGLIVPRQNGKGTILEAKTLHSLFLAKSKLVLWSAHEFKTAREAFLRCRSLIDGCDDMRKKVKAIRVGAGEEGIELTTGARLRFVARSRGSGRGFAAPDVILDEAFALTDEQMGALMPTLSAQPDPQIWYASSAPLAVSVVLRRLMKRGRAGNAPGLAYMEWSADPELPNDDPEAWAAANPAWGTRITTGTFAREMGSMEDAEYRRERLGIVDLDDLASQVLEAKVWAALGDEQSQATDPVTFAVDVTPDRASAAICMAGYRQDGRRHVEVVQQGGGTRWVVDRLVQLVSRWNVCAVGLDANSPAASMIPDLERRGIVTDPKRDQTQLEIVGSSSMAQACGGWYDAATSDQLRHIDQTPLNAALTGARQRPIGDGGWKWSRKDSSVDISPLVAVTLADYALALHGAASEPEPEPAFAWG